jgi:hypothetical protein
MRAEGQITRSDLDLGRLYTGQFIDEINRFDVPAVERRSREAR